MLEYAYGYDEVVAGFVAGLIPAVRGIGFGATAKAIGIVEGTELIAGIVYHNFDPVAEIIEMSGAALPGKAWLTRETLKRMYQYPFIVCGCQMTVMRVPADNEVLLSILANFNYHFISVPRMFGRHNDGVLCCLTYEEWCANKFNKRLRHHDIPQPIFAEAAE